MAETKKTAVEKTTAKAVAAKGADVKKEEVKTDAVAAAKEAPKAAVEAPKAAKETVKKPAAKKAAKTTTKKTAAKKTTKAADKEAAAPKTAGRKAAVKSVIHMQFSGKSYTTENLVQSAKDVWQYDLGRKPEDFKTVSLYVKPEESKVYYVINDDVDGSFNI